MVSGLALALLFGLCSSTPKVVLVGMDGMSFELLDPLVRAGKMPNVARVLERGARAVLKSEEPMRSPALWTTIATGQSRQVHGIYDFVTGSGYWPRPLRQTKRQLVTSNMRRSQALWQYSSQADRESLVVGWLNTWPAEPVLGVMVAPYVALNSNRQTTIKGRIYDNVERQTYPSAAFAELRDDVVSAERVDATLMRRIVDEPPSDAPLMQQIPLLRRYLYAVRWTLASAWTNANIVERLMRQHPDAALVMTYFDGADTLGHRFWAMRESLPQLRARLHAQKLPVHTAAELKQRFGRAVEGYYEVFDEVLGRIVAAAGNDATVIIVSDHGFGSAQSVASPQPAVPFDGRHTIEGVFMASGPAIVKGNYASLTQYDIAPTVLALIGVAVPDELPGHVVYPMLNRKALPAARVPAVARKPSPTPAKEPLAAPFSDVEMERLRALGYVQ